MSYVNNVNSGFFKVAISDGTINCNVAEGSIQITLGMASCSSITSGIVIRKIGNQHPIYLCPDTQEGTILRDNTGDADFFEIPKTKRRPVTLFYNAESKIWSLVSNMEDTLLE